MTSGTNTLVNNQNTVEISNISPFGIWILLNDTEYFIDYNDYPYFQNASIRDISNVEVDFSKNLHWNNLDIDIEFDAIENPEKYQLMYK